MYFMTFSMQQVSVLVVSYEVGKWSIRVTIFFNVNYFCFLVEPGMHFMTLFMKQRLPTPWFKKMT